jgi:uncharacterized protein YkwD
MGISLNGNIVDLIIIIFVAVYILGKLNKGAIQGLFDLAGFIFSLLFALKFYFITATLLSSHLSLQHGFANAIGFFIMAFIGELLFFILSIFLIKLFPPSILSSSLNKHLSFIPALASSLILVAFFLTAVIVLPIRPNIKQAVATSHIGGYLTGQTIGLDQYINSIFGGAVQEALAFMTVKPESNESVNLHFTTSDVSTDPESERQMLILVNKERSSRGLGILTANEQLRVVGRAHCTDMFKRGYFSHYTPEGLSPFDRMDQAGIKYQAAGENLAYAPDVTIAHQGLMNSPGHKANILSKNFHQVGIGVINAGIYGRMFCQEFSN